MVTVTVTVGPSPTESGLQLVDWIGLPPHHPQDSTACDHDGVEATVTEATSLPA
jgi:hypothetical protein